MSIWLNAKASGLELPESSETQAAQCGTSTIAEYQRRLSK